MLVRSSGPVARSQSVDRSVRQADAKANLGHELGVAGMLVATMLLAVGCGGDGALSPPPPVASVVLVTPAANLLVGGTEQLTATTEDAEGQVLSGRAVAWSSSDPLVASISATGLVTALSVGTVTITATSERVSGIGTVAVIRLVFAAVSAGDYQTCGVTTAGNRGLLGRQRGGPGARAGWTAPDQRDGCRGRGVRSRRA